MRPCALILGCAVACSLTIAGCERQPPSLDPRAKSLTGLLRKETYERDLEQIAKPRPPHSAHWQTVQDLCVARFESAGFAVQRQATPSGGVNVIGTLAGRSPELVVLGAHYDSVPDCPGADDNATGVAGLLQIADALGTERFQNTLLVACWDQEEMGLLGSQAHAASIVDKGVPVILAVSLETIGFTDHASFSQSIPFGFGILYPYLVSKLRFRGQPGDFLAAISDGPAQDAAAVLQRYAEVYGLPLINLRVPNFLKTSGLGRNLQRSDHAAFWQHDLPAMMLSDTANFRNPGYHCWQRPDTVEHLDAEFTMAVLRSVVGMSVELLQPTPLSKR